MWQPVSSAKPLTARRRTLHLPVLSALLIFGVVPLFGVESDSKSNKEQRAESLREMLRHAESTKLYLQTGKARTPAKLVETPIFRYSDEPRFIEDASVWVWGVKGRPQAICKIKRYKRDVRPWLYCMASLSTGKIESEWQDGHRWKSTKPGIKLLNLPGGPQPSKNKTARLRQIRSISRRFAATLIETPINRQHAMRLLPRPMYRYADAQAGLTDGAIFGLTTRTNGTNPDALLLVELHKQGTAPPKWKFALAGMTQGALSVELDGKEVWTKEMDRRTWSATDLDLVLREWTAATGKEVTDGAAVG